MSIANKFWLVLALVVLVVAGYGYWRYTEVHPSTDDAYLGANVVRIGAPVEAPVSAVHVRSYQSVVRDQALFELDPESFRLAVERAEILLQQTMDAVGGTEAGLARIRPGQSARIGVDMYPDLELAGVVESLSPASGAAFSLLPPENATGNWVKVTQRFPVRIRVTGGSDPGRALRLGASCSVRIDTRSVAQDGS